LKIVKQSLACIQDGTKAIRQLGDAALSSSPARFDPAVASAIGLVTIDLIQKDISRMHHHIAETESHHEHVWA
jgi:hypothetical protein